MTTYNTSFANADGWGRPAFEVLDDYTMSVLLSGVTPPLGDPMNVLLAPSQTLAKFTVVGLNSSNQLVPATWNATPANAIKPIGVLAQAATSDSTNSKGVRGGVYYSGCFNIDEKSPLIWDASFDTELKKAQAFIGSPAPCQIVARRRLAPTS